MSAWAPRAFCCNVLCLSTLVFRCVHAEPGGGQEGVAGPLYCSHGIPSLDNKSCACFEGWATAGITDTVNFLEGVCEQFLCTSDEDCRIRLRLPDATCPVRRWNCYCGWEKAWAHAGHGYETPGAQGGECMGVMYTFSLWISDLLWRVLTRLWCYTLGTAFVLLPFGCRRTRCRHHRASLVNAFRACWGAHPCRGDCVTVSEYDVEFFMADVGWSVWALEMGLWLYALCTVLWCTAMVAWCILLWLVVLVILLVALIASAIGLCGEGVGAFCDSAGSCHVSSCSCDLCCCGPGQDASASGVDMFYYAGPMPYDPFWGYGAEYLSTGRNECPSCAWWLRPLAWVAYMAPAPPENVWGGAMGYCILGTHPLTPDCWAARESDGVVSALRRSCASVAPDLHENESWRLAVGEWLGVEGREGRQFQEQRAAPAIGRQGHQAARVGGVRCRRIRRSFRLPGDALVPSSAEDYAADCCWICRDGSDTWDLWTNCRHVFCAACSSEMLMRRMPCPLCRTHSHEVLRGWCWARRHEEHESGTESDDASHANRP